MGTPVVVAPPVYAPSPRRRLVRPKRRSFVTTALAVLGRVLVTMPRQYGDAGAPVSVRSTRGAGTILVAADQFRLGPGGGPSRVPSVEAQAVAWPVLTHQMAGQVECLQLVSQALYIGAQLVRSALAVVRRRVSWPTELLPDVPMGSAFLTLR